MTTPETLVSGAMWLFFSLGLRMTDPLSTAITAAVEAAFDAKINPLLAQLKPPPIPTFEDRFIPIREVAQRVRADRSTIARRAKSGKFPPLRKLGNSVGYLESDLRKIFDAHSK